MVMVCVCGGGGGCMGEFRGRAAFYFQLVRFIWKLKCCLYFIHSKDHESDPSSANKPSAIYMCPWFAAQCRRL